MKRVLLLLGIVCIASALAAAVFFGSFSGQAATACDELAAHPADLQRSTRVKGISDGDVDVPKALEVCLTDTEKAPDSLTLRFQLGRVLFLAGQKQEAQSILQSAADDGYFAASAYLGELSDGLVEALSHHATAASGGFQPSEARAQELDNEVAALQKTSPAAALERCDYLASHPDDGERPRSAFGVLDANIDAEAAVDACTDAVRLNPENGRMKFQLARGLLVSGLEEESKNFFIEADAAGHQLSASYLETHSSADPGKRIALSCETFSEFTQEGGNLFGQREDKFDLDFDPENMNVGVSYDEITVFDGAGIFSRNKKYAVKKFSDEELAFETDNFGRGGRNDAMMIDLDEWSLFHFQSWLCTRDLFGNDRYCYARFYGFCSPK